MAVYLIYGEETYLLETKLKKIKKDFGELIAGINYVSLDETNIEHLLDELETPAFGYAKKMIIAKSTGLFKKEKNTARKTKKEKTSNTNLPLSEKIANYIKTHKEELENSIDLIFIEQEVQKNSLYEEIEKIGEVKEFALLKLPDLISNLKKVANAYQVSIDDATAKYLVECSGTSMQDLMNEIRKLIEYQGAGGKITKKDIDLLCIKQIQAVIFDLTDNLGKKEIGKALETLQGLILNKEPIQRILVMLYNHFKKLYIIKIAEKYNLNLVTAMNLKPNQMFLVSKYKGQASYFKEDELIRILEELISLDANYKIGQIDLEIGLTTILCTYCSK